MKKTMAALISAAAMAMVFTATPASASSIYVNERFQYIAALPSTGAYTCQQQHLHMDAGNYDWILSGLQFGPADRYMKLAAGYYTWTDCLRYYEPGIYEQYSVLDPDNNAYATARFSTYDYSTGTTYYWGGRFDPA